MTWPVEQPQSINGSPKQIMTWHLKQPQSMTAWPVQNHNQSMTAWGILMIRPVLQPATESVTTSKHNAGLTCDIATINTSCTTLSVQWKKWVSAAWEGGEEGMRQVDKDTCMHKHTNIFIEMCIQTHTHTHNTNCVTHTHTHTCSHSCACTHACTHAYTRTHTPSTFMVHQRGSGWWRRGARLAVGWKRLTTSWRRTNSTESLISCSIIVSSGTISSGFVKYTPAHATMNNNIFFSQSVKNV